jgi:ElaB/YqjD/DUF883 family membrane-anchored ribosome-binding protein
MNDRQFEEKVRRDAAHVKKDLNILSGDAAVQIGRIEDKVSQAAVKAGEDLTTRIDGGIAQLHEGAEKLINEVQETVVHAAAAVKKEIGQGVTQYNAKAQQVVDKIPGRLGWNAARYPWVAVSIALVAGILLGALLKPGRRSISYV